MELDVTAKSVVGAAQGVFDTTIALWEWDEQMAGAAAEERAGRHAAYANEEAQVAAFRSRGPRVWEVHSTPDEVGLAWTLVPRDRYGRASELEALEARREGHLVVQPGDLPLDLTEKLKTIRAARKAVIETGVHA
jgi:hypothetical protein